MALRPFIVCLVAVVAVIIAGVGLAGCESPGTASTTTSQVPGPSNSGPTSPVSSTAVSTASDAVAAALRWVEAGTSEAITYMTAKPADASAPEEELFIYTYAAGGQIGRMESAQDLYEPIVPFPLIWSGDTYYLDTENFSIPGTGRPGLAADISGIRAALASSDETWKQLGNYLSVALASLRVGDPLRLLAGFTPTEGALPPETGGLIILEGAASKRVLVGSDVLLNAASAALEGNSENPLLPDEITLTLTLSSADCHPIELRVGGFIDKNISEILVRWERASEAPAVPVDYIPLMDIVQPATNPGPLLAKAAAWMEAAPLAIAYPDGSALLDASWSLFEISDLPGRDGWGGAFPDEASAGTLLKKEGYFLWTVEQPSFDWVAADQLELHKAVEKVLGVPVAERSTERAEAVYRAVVRAFLLDVLDPHWWVKEMQASIGQKFAPSGTGMAVSKTGTGYAVRASMRDEQLFPPLQGYTSLIVTLGNPPGSIAKLDPADRPWNYTQEYALTLETDSEGRPVSLTIVSNAPPGFAALQSLRMTFERTEDQVGTPIDGSTLSQYLNSL